MTGALGGVHYQTPVERGLGSITVQSYQHVYDDQGKFMSKLAGDVSFLAANARKQQAGIDKANENFIQQFQDMIADVITLLGGGGDTGFDFGDLRYVVIAIGALFGFTDGSGKINLPINLFQAAWHFFFNFLLPVDNFHEAIDVIIDEMIATAIDIFGEVPIVGQAVEQLAVIISDIRDLLDPVADAVQAFLGIFTIDLGTTSTLPGISNYFGPLKPIWDMFVTALDGIVLPDFTVAFHKFAVSIAPFMDELSTIVQKLMPLITETMTGSGGALIPLINMIDPLMQALAPYIDILVELAVQLGPIIDLIVGVINMFLSAGTFPASFDPSAAITNFINGFLNPSGLITAILDPSSTVNASQIVGTLAAALIPNLDASKISTGTLLASLIPALTSSWGKTIDASLILGAVSSAASVAVGGITGLATGIATWLTGGGALPSTVTATAAQIISGIFGAGLIPNLDASKLTTGTLLLSLIPALSTSKITSGTFASQFFPMFALQQSAATNWVLDPSVENSTAWAWTINNSAGAQVFSTEQAHSGTHSLKTIGGVAVYLNTSDVGLNIIKSRPGESWRIGMWIYPAAANLANAGGVYFDLNCTGPTGTFTTNLAGANLAPTLVKGQWNYVEQVLTVPAGSYNFSPLFWTPGIPAGDIYYIDDILVREETQPQSIIQKIFGGTSVLGAIVASVVPNLDASKLTTGTLLASLIPALSSAWGKTVDSSLLVNAIASALIPNLDASKITTGQFLLSLIPSLTSSWTGTLDGSRLVGTVLSSLLSGVLGSGLIPNLDASKLTTGTLLASLIPALGAGWGKTIDASLILGAVSSAANVAVGGITGLALGIGSWLSSGGALPAATTILGSALSSAISAANVPGIDATKIITGQISQARATWAAQQDVLAAAWGGTAGMTNSQFQTLASQITPTAVGGMFGAANIEAAVQAYLDSHVQGLTGINSLINQGTAQVQTITQQLMQWIGYNYSNPSAPQSGSVAAQSNANNTNLNNRAVQKPPYANIDPTTDATFEFREIWQNATAPTVAITQAGGAVLGDITIRDGGPKQAVTWYGYPTGGTLANITGFFINLYSTNLTTNVRTLVYQSPNIVASVVTGTTPKFNSYTIPVANYLNTAGVQGIKYTAEIAISGTGTYNICAQTVASWVDFHSVYGLHGETRPFNQFDNTTSVASAAFGTTPGSLSTTMNIDARSTILVVHATALRTVGTATPAMTMTVGTGGSQKTLTAAAQFSYTDTRGYLFQQWAFVVTNPPTGTAIPMQLNQNTSGITWGLSFGALSYIGPNGYGTPQFNSGSGTSGSLVATNGTIGGWNTVSFTAGGATIASGTATTGYTSRTQQNTGAASAPIVVGDAPGSASNTFTEGINSGSTGWGILVLPLTTNPPSTFTPATGASTQANPVVYSHVVPWIGLSGVAATPVYQPVTKTINSGIGQSFDPATFAPWANYVDVMQWADGSAGAPGSPTNSGAGGGAGGAQVTTLSKSQFISGAWTLDVGTGGTNVAAAQQNRVVIPGYGTRTVAGAGPQVASGSINQGDTGANGATISYTDAHGVAQSYGGGSGGVGPTGNGGAPGAGGSGGAVFWYGSGTPGNGGPGMTLLRFYQ